ncbi:MAG: hypothetical protein ACFFBH_04445 [Promethearchaeota archaeon]
MIQEIIILSNTGIPLFNYTIDDNLNKKYDYRLIASYFDQICRFTRYKFNQSLVTLKIGKNEFYFYTSPDKVCHLVIKTDNKKMNKKTVDLFAKEILDKFSSKFKMKLIEFNGNINVFKSFTKDIERLIKTKNLKSITSRLF